MKGNLSKKQLREFGFLIGMFFPILIGWIIPAFSGHAFRIWTLYVGIPFLIVGILKPKLLVYPYQWWMVLGECLGWVNSRLLLGIVFIIILQPIALFMKIFGYDPLGKKKCYKKSYRIIKTKNNMNLDRIF